MSNGKGPATAGPFSFTLEGMTTRYMPIPERMMLAGLSEGEAKVRRKRIATCITDKSTPFKWLRMRISAERAANTTDVPQCNSADRAARFIVGAYPAVLDAYAEHIVVLCLDAMLYPVAVYPAHVGARASSLADPRTILVPAILATPTTRFIVAHNHPSGNTSFSTEDRELFQRLKQAAEVLGFRCDDLLIITETHVASLAAGSVERYA